MLQVFTIYIFFKQSSPSLRLSIIQDWKMEDLSCKLVFIYSHSNHNMFCEFKLQVQHIPDGRYYYPYLHRTRSAKCPPLF